MKRLFIASLFFIPFVSNAAPTFDELREKNPEVCKDISKEDGYPGFVDCVVRMNEASEQKLQARLPALRKDLDSLSLIEYRANFDQNQKAWEEYKKTRCTYLTTGMEGQARDFEATMCNLMENYQRLDVLEGEPAFP
ncbi:lysozyme inhibitor LprI family protein [Enterobacillus tribolii]|uniref:Uncharacterized protein DUF1311 n=1 Tax=Enterobacillus tribolii TaxID=1487935 RepID=A0A370QRR9_9GAMM|nr:lysozyme inhibitor LprI family protein [Enterobacillus tribolii]RDK91954.1 uncharacterized protein DUF1311 [Enterobacillus tribolii]